MNPKDFQALFQQTWNECADLASIKGGEYASDADKLANFKESGRRLDLIPEKSLLVLADKHYASVCNYIKDLEMGRSRPRSESIYGRLNDLINYMILLRGLLEERGATADAIHEEARTLRWEDIA